MSEISKITNRIYSNSRMELEFFMYLPTGTYRTKDGTSLLINCNPILNLRYKKSDKIVSEYDYTKAAYRITPRNLYNVIVFLNTVVNWFFGDEYKDLYLENENGDLIFNADYNKLSASTRKGDYDQQIMQAIPTIVRYGDKLCEGIHLYVNKSEYCIPLVYHEVATIFGLLKDFNFTAEVTNTILCYQYIIENQAFVSDFRVNGKTPFD